MARPVRAEVTAAVAAATTAAAAAAAGHAVSWHFYPGDTTRCAHVVARGQERDRPWGSATPCSPRLSANPGHAQRAKLARGRSRVRKWCSRGARRGKRSHIPYLITLMYSTY